MAHILSCIPCLCCFFFFSSSLGVILVSFWGHEKRPQTYLSALEVGIQNGPQVKFKVLTGLCSFWRLLGRIRVLAFFSFMCIYWHLAASWIFTASSAPGLNLFLIFSLAHPVPLTNLCEDTGPKRIIFPFQVWLINNYNSTYNCKFPCLQPDILMGSGV